MAVEPTPNQRELSRAEPSRREPSLRPVRWSGRPGPGTLLRAALVATFLTLAAGLIYAQEPVTCAGGSSSGGTTPGDLKTDGRAGAGPGGSAPAGGSAGSSGPAGSPGPADAAGPAGSAGGPDGSAPLPIPRGLVGVPVRLADPAAAEAVRPGRRVDLLAVPVRATVEQPTVLASAALVLDVLTGDAPAALVLALEPTQARRAVGQPETTRFAVVLR
jgi:hypothetical protein